MMKLWHRAGFMGASAAYNTRRLRMVHGNNSDVSYADSVSDAQQLRAGSRPMAPLSPLCVRESRNHLRLFYSVIPSARLNLTALEPQLRGYGSTHRGCCGLPSRSSQALPIKTCHTAAALRARGRTRTFIIMTALCIH